MVRSQALIDAQKRYRQRIKEKVKKGEMQQPEHIKKSLKKYFSRPEIKEKHLKYIKERRYYKDEDSILRSIRKLFM